MIPKVIHYCWFGGNPLPDNLKKYIETWKIYCPDYEIKEWNEQTFDINSHPFTKSAYENRKWAYVSDYVRAFALFNEGGIYLDTDVELKANLDLFLKHEAFTGFEAKGLPFTAVWGTIKGHSMPKKVLEYYTNRVYSSEQETNTASVTKLLIDDFKIDPNNNILQIGKDGVNNVHIYPAEYFCLDLLPNYATHHFEGSWIDRENKISAKEQIHFIYYTNKILESNSKSFNSLLKALASSIRLKDIIKLSIYFVYYKFIPTRLKNKIKGYINK